MQLTKNLGYLGLLGAILVGIGEFYLHYSTNVLMVKGQFNFFEFVPMENLKIGHFIAILGIPFYFAGYLHIYRMLKSGNETLARTVLGLGFIAFTVGAVWIGSRGYLGSLVRLKSEMPFETYDKIIANYNSFLEILVQVLRVVIALLSIAFSWAILKGGTLYQKYMAVFNPIFILVFFMIIGMALPQIGKYFLPILMNITHFVLFSLSLLHLNKHTQND
ncbi:MAG: hypothetical protein GW772_10275 [Flavobacteriia bacterium]|nr:hypothetical protein [Flavobacteriia bacterium]OIP45273.1 MAG: hypothetical protein AUK46_12505 [Flavobacteriaceae bacterium CG2_30_31_66]PIV97997.1 MAG: hypothetical protein COW43_00170 [Flavobacteriaceae bacterium CG17_big_fil_post_rev_8_21_14_2_50_31_13]PIX12561.1 MAG: hypothetical protein COZ74_10925 [Flavobacteriaceae bacterium CG_4_8_14_3_um_filter_31_8]PIY14093.1 MAG: hypothetical protein COZ16_10770 [Flavobacteriaceae bacterium CG_4_10_14_3_um_filter_31_253]PIZ10213.1 MAG: hypotheti